VIILGVETSCDESSAALVRDGVEMLSNVVASQVDLHARYGGVVPELAARAHVEAIAPVISEALLPFLRTVLGGGDAWDADPTIRRAIEIRDGVIQNPAILSFQGRATVHPHFPLAI